MKKVYSIDEAREFFLSNGRDSCLCVKGDDTFVAECYPDAVDFFTR